MSFNLQEAKLQAFNFLKAMDSAGWHDAGLSKKLGNF
jgi:hypothetical protein